MTMYNFLKHITLNEGSTPKTLHQDALKFKRDDLEPCISEDTMDLHYGKLYKGYVDRFNKGEGDAEFNEAGAWLHRLYFSQLKAPDGASSPTGVLLEFIETHFKTWANFKDKFEIAAMKVQGSGWVYLARNGEIKTIKNHQIRQDIVIIIDWWEHAWVLDHGSNKKSYLRDQWRIMDWDMLNMRVI